MNLFRLVVCAFALPFILTACQTAQSGSSSYAGGGLLTKKPVKKSVKTKAKGFPPNEAASLLVKDKRPAKKAKAVSKPKAASKRKSKTTITKKVKGRRSGTVASGRKRYRKIIAKHARANGVPLRLAMAVVQVESSYRANARGAAGEIGLMQLMPRTARFIGYKGKLKNLYNPDTNIRYGMKYLGKAYKLGGRTSCGAILKYNAGHGAKRMNPISRRYCNRVRRIMRRG